MRIKFILIYLLLLTVVFPSGGYDHGTSTGKGQIEIDLTWNPFDLIDFGQTYAVIGIGLTNRLDIHGYFAHQTNDNDNYYYGLFYQFLDTKYLDLSTAIGQRRYTRSKSIDIFYPQLLYTIKFNENVNIGGAIVFVKRKINGKYIDMGSAFDVAAYFSLKETLNLPGFIEDMKLGIGLFNPGIFEPDYGDFLPTYSIDIIFKKIWGKE